MIDKTGAYHFTVDSDMVDIRRQITIPAIGAKLLDAATVHAEGRGFGYLDMLGRNTAWVLSRLVISMSRRPSLGEDVTVYTWIEGASGMFTYRSFEMVSAVGGVFGYARSVWAAIDIDSRRPTPLDTDSLNRYRVERSCPIDKPSRIAHVEGITKGRPYVVRYSDLDINGHLNSIRYIERLLDMFDIAFFTGKDITRFEVAYMAEGIYGMSLSIHLSEAANDVYNMAVCHGGKAICRAAVTFTDVAGGA
ncbi:MAG: acyl-[acyl-carrier-protein] thioesterase [Tannerellaceae bacterium]|jgi:acyl-ACP thioesterase|nr:acyl-[acyl-carrier-protein] thioesterase [Tannerellaceae bacterium]